MEIMYSPATKIFYKRTGKGLKRMCFHQGAKTGWEDSDFADKEGVSAKWKPATPEQIAKHGLNRSH